MNDNNKREREIKELKSKKRITGRKKHGGHNEGIKGEIKVQISNEVKTLREENQAVNVNFEQIIKHKKEKENSEKNITKGGGCHALSMWQSWVSIPWFKTHCNQLGFFSHH